MWALFGDRPTVQANTRGQCFMATLNLVQAGACPIPPCHWMCFDSRNNAATVPRLAMRPSMLQTSNVPATLAKHVENKWHLLLATYNK